MDELALDHCFWNAISTSRPFFDWLMSKTKFSGRTLRLVTDEKWHQRWYRRTGNKAAVGEGHSAQYCKTQEMENVSPLHIENKPRLTANGGPSTISQTGSEPIKTPKTALLAQKSRVGRACI